MGSRWGVRQPDKVAVGWGVDIGRAESAFLVAYRSLGVVSHAVVGSGREGRGGNGDASTFSPIQCIRLATNCPHVNTTRKDAAAVVSITNTTSSRIMEKRSLIVVVLDASSLWQAQGRGGSSR